MALARRFRVSRPTIYKALDRGRGQEFAPRKSANTRYLNAKYGLNLSSSAASAPALAMTAEIAFVQFDLFRQERRVNRHLPGNQFSQLAKIQRGRGRFTLTRSAAARAVVPTTNRRINAS